MKTLKTILLFFILLSVLSCNSKTVSKDQQSPVSAVTTSAGNSDKIEAYYFHFTVRCETCKTIEANTKENLETLYPEYVKQGLITFQSLNLDDASVRQIAEKLGITSQALLFTKGDQKINLTNEGFLYAVAKPEKFREIINEKVEFLLTR
jgi:hypothetical protein